MSYMCYNESFSQGNVTWNWWVFKITVCMCHYHWYVTWQL